jgi:hypothetical protein
VSRYGYQAAAAEPFQECALGRTLKARLLVIYFANKRVYHFIGGARLNRKRALSDGRQHKIETQMLRNAPGVAQPVQTGRGEYYGVEFSFIKLAKASVDVAANGLYAQVRSQGADLRLATQAARAYQHSLGDFFKRAYAASRDQRIAHVFSLAYCSDVEAGGQLRRQVLKAVNREVYAAFDDGFFKLLGKESLSLFAKLRQRHVEHPVTFGRYDHDFNLKAGMVSFNFPLNPVGLPERQLAASRSYDNFPVQVIPSHFILRVSSCAALQALR